MLTGNSAYIAGMQPFDLRDMEYFGGMKYNSAPESEKPPIAEGFSLESVSAWRHRSMSGLYHLLSSDKTPLTLTVTLDVGA